PFFYSSSILITHTKIILCISISLFSSFLIPFKCLLFIFFYSNSIIITHTKIILCLSMSLFICFFIPFNCLLFIFFYSSSICIALTKITLCLSSACFFIFFEINFIQNLFLWFILKDDRSHVYYKCQLSSLVNFNK